MNHADFHTYIDCFNRNDFDGFSRYYHQDVVLELGSKACLQGRQAIIDFYRQVKARVEETLVIDNLIIDDLGVAAELNTRFLALADWPDFIAGPMRQGDSIHIISLVHYRLEQGVFRHIKSARYKTF